MGPEHGWFENSFPFGMASWHFGQGWSDQVAKRSVEPKGNASHKARTPGTKTDLRLQLVVFTWTFLVFRKIGGLGSIFYHPIGNT